MQSCMLQMTCSIPIFNDRKLKELRNWLLYYLLIEGGLGGGEGLCPPRSQRHFGKSNEMEAVSLWE